MYSIQCEIEFNNQTLKIDRTKLVETIEEYSEEAETIIVSGEGGSGKTALIKEFYEKVKGDIPFYIFKAVEFNILDVNGIFNKYGNYSLNEFIEMHKYEDNKFIVIDSAEKLSDLENQDVFKEFLSALFKNSWKIIFTTRYSYLDDLRFQFIEIYKLPFQVMNIENISAKKLKTLSEKYDFKLPNNKRLRKLIQNLFYLDEYLQNYQSIDHRINYSNFKNILWKKKIQKSTERKDNLHIERENCFLNLVRKRCESGLFFVEPEQCSNKALSKLETDEIIKYDSKQGGYFITHDIYEEWALEKIIEREFKTSRDYNDFFEQLGTSLPIRRAFRNWLSEKLIEDIDDIKLFIENVFLEEEIKSFWKDEILVSVLLSNYSQSFFNQFEKIIFRQDQHFLKKIIFLLRIACKEVDNSFLNNFDFKDNNVNLKHVFTKPKGAGWSYTIDFLYNHIDKFNPTNIDYIVPLLQDWNNNNKTSETTRKASLFALHFYNEIEFNDKYRYSSDIKEELIKIILHGASKIQDELKNVFEQIIENDWKNHRSPYFDLCSAILTSTYDNIPIIFCLPDYIIKIANLFWFITENENPLYTYDGIGAEKHYSLTRRCHNDYGPASAFQTPIYWLLKSSLKKTIDFILEFTNKAVKSYAISGFDKSVEEIDIIVDSEIKIKQFISNSLWNMYRGTGAPITPYLLQSIHMALEKYLLEFSKTDNKEIVESWLIYLIKNSKSASITSVITSVVLAYPDKLFNVAKILFKTNELFLYDNMRARSENQAKNLYSIGRGLNYQHKIFEDERIKTCDESHRELSLEDLIRYYQFFGDKNIDEKEFKKRQKVIWKIIDECYSKLADNSNKTDDNKTLRLLLARIDRRKMNPNLEQTDDGLLIDFNPELEEDLQKFSEESIKESNDMMKYTPLKLWATHKFNKNEKYKNYEQYEKNPQLVLKETKEIIDGLNNNNNRNFYLLNSSTPAYTCYTLIKEYDKQLTGDEKEYCKNILIEYAIQPFHPNYQYQIGDGVEVAINTLPFLFKLYPDEKEDFKMIFLLILFDSYPLGEYKRVCDYSIEAILNNLWDISYDDAQAIFLGFLKLKSKFNQLRNKIQSSYNQKNFKNQVLEKFNKKYESELEAIISNNISYSDIQIDKLELEVLETGFQMIPSNTSNDIHLDFIMNIISNFSKQLLTDDDNIDFSLRIRFFEKFSYFILNRKEKNINKFIQPFIDGFSDSREMAFFFQKLIFTEDKINKYNKFWNIWESFYDEIVNMCNNRTSSYHLSEIVHNYLLAWPYWSDTARKWHSLKDREKLFYKKVSKDIGHCPSVLYSISKLLNEIGSDFLNEGIFWISEMIEKNSNLLTEELETNTIYYIEILIRKYAYLNRPKIKTDLKIKNKIIIILNFLIEKGSVNAYLLREDLL